MKEFCKQMQMSYLQKFMLDLFTSMQLSISAYHNLCAELLSFRKIPQYQRSLNLYILFLNLPSC